MTLLELYDAHGDARYGEGVTQTEHALQCAAEAERDGAPEVLVLAALLHDVGHLLEHDAAILEGGESYGAKQHDLLGAAYLRARGFPERGCAAIAAHVTAKRYLCFAEPGYEDRLSAASRVTLAHQGGPMDAAEASRWRARPEAVDALALRRWDDAGKSEGVTPPPLSSYVDRVARILGT